MIDLDEWRPLAMAALRETFGERLLCVGLQGSYLRGEARPDSDIDLLVVLDHVELTDLDRFHEAMRAVPEGGKAVGFTCGRDELAAWPAYELAQFEHGTQVWAWRPACFASRLWAGRCPAWCEGKCGEPLSHDQPHVSDDAGAACGCPSGRFARHAQGVLLLLADRPRRSRWCVRSDQARTACRSGRPIRAHAARAQHRP